MQRRTFEDFGRHLFIACLTIVLAAGCSNGVEPQVNGGTGDQYKTNDFWPMAPATRWDYKFSETESFSKGHMTSSITGSLTWQIVSIVTGDTVAGVIVRQHFVGTVATFVWDPGYHAVDSTIISPVDDSTSTFQLSVHSDSVVRMIGSPKTLWDNTYISHMLGQGFRRYFSSLYVRDDTTFGNFNDNCVILRRGVGPIFINYIRAGYSISTMEMDLVKFTDSLGRSSAVTLPNW